MVGVSFCLSLQSSLPSFAMNTYPFLKTPKPTQPYNDPRYHNLLDISNPYSYTSRRYLQSRSVLPVPLPPLPTHSSSSSSIPSPSSTLCSTTSSTSSSGATTLLLEDVYKETGQPSSSKSQSLDSSFKIYGSDMSISSHPSSPTPERDCFEWKSRARYERWMLNAEAAAYSSVFSPFFESNEGQDHGETQAHILEYSSSSTNPPGPHPQPIAPYRHIHPNNKRWSKFFNLGCQHRDPDTRSYYARRIIQSQRWDESEGHDRLLELVHAFVWHATNADDNLDLQERQSVAEFAARVRDSFEHASKWVVPPPRESLEIKFGSLMRETVLATFLSCWHVVSGYYHYYYILAILAFFFNTPLFLSHQKPTMQ